MRFMSAWWQASRAPRLSSSFWPTARPAPITTTGKLKKSDHEQEDGENAIEGDEENDEEILDEEDLSNSENDGEQDDGDQDDELDAESIDDKKGASQPIKDDKYYTKESR